MMMTTTTMQRSKLKHCYSKRKRKKRLSSSKNDFLRHYKAAKSLRIRLSERQEGKRERQVILSLVLLIKFVLFLIFFRVSFSFNL